MGEIKNAYTILVTKAEGRISFGRLGVDGWIIFEWFLRGWRFSTGCIWLRIGIHGGLLWTP